MFSSKPKTASSELYNTPEQIRILEEIINIGYQFFRSSLNNNSIKFDEFSLREIIMDFCLESKNLEIAVTICPKIDEVILSFNNDFKK
jgi:hypothetical protein